MDSLHLTLRPRAAFGGAIKGDTLFGQLCWAARNRWGEARLAELLDGYTEGRPFAVCSDAFPRGSSPKTRAAATSLCRASGGGPQGRKAPPVGAARGDGRARGGAAGPVPIDAEVAADLGGRDRLAEVHAQPHNSIHRLTGTTAAPEFAPYTQEQHWFAAGIDLHVYMLVIRRGSPRPSRPASDRRRSRRIRARRQHRPWQVRSWARPERARCPPRRERLLYACALRAPASGILFRCQPLRAVHSVRSAWGCSRAYRSSLQGPGAACPDRAVLIPPACLPKPSWARDSVATEAGAGRRASRAQSSRAMHPGSGCTSRRR